ncbi:MAG: formylglycine-generating enzyme family protein [Candidatus Cloacimonetes bacterium]|nr:formylglycine-generating enzyme family protein [Candidatus Cloacimonadota bacterium]
MLVRMIFIAIIVFVVFFIIFNSWEKEKIPLWEEYKIPVSSLPEDMPDFEWCLVPAGDFTYGPPKDTSNYSSVENIDYDYEIMKYPVTNAQYLAYLRQALAAEIIWVDERSNAVYGNHPRIKKNPYHKGGEVAFYYLGDVEQYSYYRQKELKESDSLLYEHFEWFLSYDFSQIYYSEGEFKIFVPSGYEQDGYLDHPVVFTTWFGASHFAQYYGLRLPNNLEWEKAARGNRGYIYPWGNEIDGTRANYRDSGDPWDNRSTPVGYYNGINPNTVDSPSPYGVYDMSGNVRNWVQDWITSEELCGNYPVNRNGSWYDCTGHMHSWIRDDYHFPVYNAYWAYGFRCARSPIIEDYE